jgi:hypothetical protein
MDTSVAEEHTASIFSRDYEYLRFLKMNSYVQKIHKMFDARVGGTTNEKM